MLRLPRDLHSRHILVLGFRSILGSGLQTHSMFVSKVLLKKRETYRLASSEMTNFKLLSDSERASIVYRAVQRTAIVNDWRTIGIRTGWCHSAHTQSWPN